MRCHKALGLPSTIIMVLFVFILMSPSPNQKLKAEKMPLKWNTFFSLSANYASAMAEILPKNISKSILNFVETLERY
jgi:hypothetical protein